MTPDQRKLALEIVEAHLFDIRERRTDALRIAENVGASYKNGRTTTELRAEAGRLAGRIDEIEGLQKALAGPEEAPGDIFS